MNRTALEISNTLKRTLHYYLSAGIISIIALFSPCLADANTLAPNTTYQVCFTPGGNCTQNIVNAINDAKQSILVQAYSFTSRPIGRALLDAKDRGVSIKIILDKSQYRENGYSSAKFFQHHGIPVWLDNNVAIAHNKVIIIDNRVVITGSFNFTRAAQQDNAENSLIIANPDLAKLYTQNWNNRMQASQVLTPSSDYYYEKKSNHYGSYNNRRNYRDREQYQYQKTLWYQLKQLLNSRW
jgi:phosphatidylserine/phosphatidylglycerophosphate/cardiolipin synthase-like enzyme